MNSRNDRIAAIFIIASITISGCMRDFIPTPRLVIVGDNQLDPTWKTALETNMNACVDKLDMIRKEAYNADKRKHYSSVWGGTTTLITGSGAGAFGAANEKTVSGVFGGLSLLSGVVTLILVAPSDEQVHKDAISAEGDWAQLVKAKTKLEQALIVFSSDDPAEKAQLEEALKEFVAAANKFGLGGTVVNSFAPLLAPFNLAPDTFLPQ